MIENTETLKQQVMISHYSNATGCSTEQARQILQASRWEFETALSVFLQDASTNPGNPLHHRHHGGLSPMCAPSNTPATPPQFPDALLALQKLQANDWTPPPSQPLYMAPPTANDRYGSNCEWAPKEGGDAAPTAVFPIEAQQ